MLFSLTVPRPPDSVTVATISTSSVKLTIAYPYNENTGQCSEFKLQITPSDPSRTENIPCTNRTPTIDGLDSNEDHTVKVTVISKKDGTNYKESGEKSGSGWTCKYRNIYIQ